MAGKISASRQAKGAETPQFSTEAVLAAIDASRRIALEKSHAPELNPFRVAEHPPAATPPKKFQMAQDSALNWAGDAWAGGYLGGVIAEGLLFLGYPYLAELAQRPEYRVISETIADEMVRKWIRFKGKNTDGNERTTERIKELTDEFERLEVRDRFRTGGIQDGLFGRSHLYLDFGVEFGSKELATPIGSGRDAISKGKIKKGSLKRLQPVEAVWTYPTTYNAQNPLREDWYNPQVWYVMGQEIHCSRLLTFIGHPVPDLLKPAYSFGGLSLSQLAKPYVDIWLKTRESVGTLIHSFSVMVLMTDLQTILQPGSAAGLMQRVALFNALRDNQGTFVVNKATEDFKNVSASLAGLHELQSQSQEHMMSVARIPAVKFTGMQPSGLNASSEGELRAFGDTIHGYQEVLFRPNLTRVMNFVQLSLWGEVDPDITFDFVPLMELTEKEKAELRKLDAETDDILINGCASLSPQESRARVAADPDTPYAGLDVDVMPEPLAPEDEDEGRINIRGTEAYRGNMGADEWNPALHPRDEEGKFSETGSVAPHHASALKAYTGSGYREINGHLRGGKPASDAARAQIQHLDDILSEASLPAPQTVYRGLGSLAVQQLLGATLTAKKGQILTDSGFPSTSAVESIARQFVQINPAKNILMSIKMPSGSKALDVSKYSDSPGERETLIARNARYKVVKFDPKRRTLEVELMPHEQKNADIAKDAGHVEGGAETHKFGYETAEGLTLGPSDDPDAEEFYLG